MLTNQQVKELYGQEITFLFKGEAPFTTGENPRAPLGMLIANKDGLVACYECGGWFESVAGHVKLHNMTGDQYKAKYGFTKSASLCSKALSAKRSALTSAMIESGKIKNVTYDFSRGDKRPRWKHVSIKAKNAQNTCPEQFKERFKLLLAKFGPNMTLRQASSQDDYCVDAMQKMFGSFNKAKEVFGGLPDNHAKRKQDADLIYALRQYVAANGRLPFNKGSAGFPFSRSAYVLHFGSGRKMYQICGIKAVKKNEWCLIK